jgi:hypothetical protein
MAASSHWRERRTRCARRQLLLIDRLLAKSRVGRIRIDLAWMTTTDQIGSPAAGASRLATVSGGAQDGVEARAGPPWKSPPGSKRRTHGIGLEDAAVGTRLRTGHSSQSWRARVGAGEQSSPERCAGQQDAADDRAFRSAAEYTSADDWRGARPLRLGRQAGDRIARVLLKFDSDLIGKTRLVVCPDGRSARRRARGPTILLGNSRWLSPNSGGASSRSSVSRRSEEPSWNCRAPF